jgi:hypothetical protein
MRNISTRVQTPNTPAVGVIQHSELTREFQQKFVAMVRLLEQAKTGKYAGTKGVHSVYDGVNAELKRLGLDAIATVAELERIGVIEGHFVKGGRRIYVKGDKPNTEAKGKAFGLLG